MRKLSNLLIFGLLTFAPLNSFAQTLPNSPRLEEVSKRISPSLIADLKKKNLQFGSPVFVRIYKKSNILELWIKGDRNYKLYKTYNICTFSGNLGPKLKEGDRQAPEGIYWVSKSQLNPNSNYHLSLNLGYPNQYDRYYKRSGDALMVHGNCVSIGCYAITDRNIEEVYLLINAALKNGQDKVQFHILPFKPTKNNLIAYRYDKWAIFWNELAKIDLAFEKNFIVPKVSIKEGHYILTE
ncbi:MAG: murein L,D-transpeptidase [Caulobacterales bacterium]|nr:murein L,D-transpeptidase [Caulobacterales bacterium]MCA0371851.1 murein L,D-transpeptidase [Pseudomonadota bacterium]